MLLIGDDLSSVNWQGILTSKICSIPLKGILVIASVKKDLQNTLKTSAN